MGTVVSKRRNTEVSESTAVKIRVIAAFQGNCKDNSRDKEGQQSSCSVTESTTAADHKTPLQIKPSVAKTKFPKGVYPQRESNVSLTISEDRDDPDHIQPYRLKLGVITSSGTQLCSNLLHHNDKVDKPSQSTAAVVQLQSSGNEDHLSKEHEAEEIPDKLEWLLKKGLTAAEIHKAATVIQKTVRGYQCRRKLVMEEKSAALIQRMFRQWRKSSKMSLQKNNHDEKMFISANSIVSTAVVDDTAHVTTQDAVDHVQQLKSKQLDSINEDTDVTVSNKQQTESSAMLTADGDSSSSEQLTNSDIATALKEVFNMVIPDFNDTQVPSEKTITDMEILGQKTRDRLNALYHSSFLSNKSGVLKIGKEQYKMYLEFQNEIDETMFLAQQKAELCLGESYIPRKVLFISSRVPKVTLLQCAILPEVITFIYDFERATYVELISKMANALDEYKPGAKIKNLGIICKGGPGHLYLFANKPVTPVKLFKDHKMMTFWKVLGTMMSKLVPEETVIHFMESNVNGNKQGEQLLKDLEKLMYPSKVNVKCPLEIGTSGKLMISTYFHPPKYLLWKQKRYTKLKLY